jgi:hypothetical protein
MTRPEILGTVAAWGLLVCMLLVSLGASAEEAVGSGLKAAADAEEVEILTRNEDASIKETTIWIVLVGGEAFIRTGSTRWYGNIERDPNVVLRIDGDELPLRAELVTDEPLLERVQTAFREKYGFSDRMIGWIPFGGSRIMRLVPRVPQ